MQILLVSIYFIVTAKPTRSELMWHFLIQNWPHFMRGQTGRCCPSPSLTFPLLPPLSSSHFFPFQIQTPQSLPVTRNLPLRLTLPIADNLSVLPHLLLSPLPLRVSYLFYISLENPHFPNYLFPSDACLLKENLFSNLSNQIHCRNS